MYSLRASAEMGWGKIRRAFLIAFRKKRVQEKLQRRMGACTRCGACCKILFNCPAFDDSDGNPKCLIYNDRPGVCGLFPLDEKDLRDRNFVMPEKKCGFYFEDKPAGSGNGNGHGTIRESMSPLRWGPWRNGSTNGNGNGHANGNGRPKFLKGSLAILWTAFHRPNGKS